MRCKKGHEMKLVPIPWIKGRMDYHCDECEVYCITDYIEDEEGEIRKVTSDLYVFRSRKYD